MSAHRTRCYGYIGPDLEFVAQQALQCMVVHEQHHDIRERAANLEADAPSADGYKHRSAPAFASAASR